MRKTCTRPLIRAETWETYINKKGGTSYKVEWLGRDFYDEIKNSPNWNYWNGNKYRRIDAVPCGQCAECRLNYSREWAKDCMLEKEYHPENECWFITLTYNDENLPWHTYVDRETGEYTRGVSLSKRDLQNFWKRVRKHFKDSKILYLNAGEYGSHTGRPHYHAIVFGMPLDETKFKKIGNNENGDALWTSPELEKLWSKKVNKIYYPIGNVIIGRVTYRSVAYVCRYNLKKSKGIDSTYRMLEGKIPEFISMSQKIGYKYYRDHWAEMIETDSVPTPLGLKSIPRRFLKILQEEDQEAAAKIKEMRKKNLEYAEKTRNTDLKPEEYRKQKEQINESKFKDIRRDY